MKKNLVKNIKYEIFISKSGDKNLIGLIKRSTELPYSEILRRIKFCVPVFSAELSPQQFYSGVNEVVSFINALDALQVLYTVKKDGVECDKCDPVEIQRGVKNISLEDFR